MSRTHGGGHTFSSPRPTKVGHSVPSCVLNRQEKKIATHTHLDEWTHMNTHTQQHQYSHVNKYTCKHKCLQTQTHGIKRHASYRVTLFCRHSTRINMHPNMQIRTHTPTHTPVLRYVQINSHCHTGVLTHPERLLRIQPPRTPELYRLLYAPFVPWHPPHVQIYTYPRVAWQGPALH